MNKIIKTIMTLVLTVFLLSSTACTYLKGGVEWQDVTFNVNYIDSENEDVSIDATISLALNLAPKTTKQVLNLIKQGFYTNTALVYASNYTYLQVGLFTFSNDEYVDYIKNVSTIEGEFQKAGFDNSKDLKVQAGALVMMRDAGYNSATYKIAIVLESTSAFDNTDYCVFGKIDNDAVEKLIEMRDATKDDENGFTKVHYLGERDEGTDSLIVEGNGYKGSFTILLKEEDYFELDGLTKLDSEDKRVKIINESTINETVILPSQFIKINNFKVK